jgi:hypothetical protein
VGSAGDVLYMADAELVGVLELYLAAGPKPQVRRR